MICMCHMSHASTICILGFLRNCVWVDFAESASCYQVQRAPACLASHCRGVLLLMVISKVLLFETRGSVAIVRLSILKTQGYSSVGRVCGCCCCCCCHRPIQPVQLEGVSTAQHSRTIGKVVFGSATALHSSFPS